MISRTVQKKRRERPQTEAHIETIKNDLQRLRGGGHTALRHWCHFSGLCLSISLGFCYGVFTLPVTKTDKETDKKISCTELCGGVYTAQRQTPTRIIIRFYANLLLSVCVSGEPCERSKNL